MTIYDNRLAVEANRTGGTCSDARRSWTCRRRNALSVLPLTAQRSELDDSAACVLYRAGVV